MDDHLSGEAIEPKPSPRGPVCPVCETLVEFEPIDMGTGAGGFIATVPGPWSCPNRCDPRDVSRGSSPATTL